MHKSQKTKPGELCHLQRSILYDIKFVYNLNNYFVSRVSMVELLEMITILFYLGYLSMLSYYHPFILSRVSMVERL